MGQTRTSPGDLGMSASPSKVDIGQGEWDGRFAPLVDSRGYSRACWMFGWIGRSSRRL